VQGGGGAPYTATVITYLQHHSRTCIIISLCFFRAQERFTCKEAMAHPYFAPVREREGWDVHGEPLGAAAAGNSSSGGGRS
jgi:hypothetical protein